MAEVLPSDLKAARVIPLLYVERKHRAHMTYGELGRLINHNPLYLGNILDRVGAWCRVNGKSSLAMLVVDDDGRPRPGMYRNFPDDADPVTSENYEERHARLLDEDWSDIVLPTGEDIADAYAEVVGRAALQH